MIVTKVLEIPYNGTIGVSRPLVELSNHLSNNRLPSLNLVIRAIKVIALGLFKGHFCDSITIHGPEAVRHALTGKITRNGILTFEENYPYLFESSLFFVFKDFPNPEGKVEMDDFEQLEDINAQTISDYYRNKFNYSLTDKIEGNDIIDILNSNHLKPLEYKEYWEFGTL